MRKIKEVAPTDCASLAERGELTLGALQMPVPGADCWPSGYDLDLLAKALFGAAKIADVEVMDDDTCVTWIVIKA
jgi:hypothetical protein